MMKNVVVVLGAILVLAAIVVFAYDTVAFQPPLMGAETGQGNVNYLIFFSLALGGGGILILVFSVFQWYRKRRP